MIQYTPEQADVLDWITENDGILLVQAGAGCGKSFMSKQIVNTLQPKSGIYTAFNKAIVEEGIDRFKGTNIRCKTFHALAYQHVALTKSIETFNYRCVKENLSYPDKRIIIEAIDKFYVSASVDMFEFFEKYFEHHPNPEYMIDVCANYVEQMSEGKINPTFNFMLKALHIMLHEGTVEIDVDIVILDEINDVTAVSLEIFKLINAPKKLGLGETHQAIYQFLDLVNGFEELEGEATIMRFTQSYRCHTSIAQKIDNKMTKHLDKEFKFIGTEEPVRNNKFLYCTATNAAIVDHISALLKQGKRFKLLRNISEIFAAPLALLSASQGKKPYQKKYLYLLDVLDEFKNQNKHKTFFKFIIEELKDDEIVSAVKLLQKLNSEGTNLFQLYKEAKAVKPDPNYVVATVFTSKGLEFEEVYIADDLNSQFKKAITGETEEPDATIAMRCYYVACSRAGVSLRNSIL